MYNERTHHEVCSFIVPPHHIRNTRRWDIGSSVELDSVKWVGECALVGLVLCGIKSNRWIALLLCNSLSPLSLPRSLSPYFFLSLLLLFLPFAFYLLPVVRFFRSIAFVENAIHRCIRRICFFEYLRHIVRRVSKRDSRNQLRISFLSSFVRVTFYFYRDQFDQRLNQLAVVDEYTRHVETATYSVTTSSVGNKIKK